MTTTAPQAERKAFPADVKMRQDDPPGTVEAVVSVFGNVDAYGDVVAPGAFKRSLEERMPLPIAWAHNDTIPPIGVAQTAKETSEGLFVKFLLFVDQEDDHPVARQVWTGLKQGAIKEFSFGYRVREAEWETRDGQDVRILKDIDIFEASPVWIGANPQTRLVAVKDAATVKVDVHLDGKELAAATAEAKESTTTVDAPERVPVTDGGDAHPVPVTPELLDTVLALKTNLTKENT